MCTLVTLLDKSNMSLLLRLVIPEEVGTKGDTYGLSLPSDSKVKELEGAKENVGYYERDLIS